MAAPPSPRNRTNPKALRGAEKAAALLLYMGKRASADRRIYHFENQSIQSRRQIDPRPAKPCNAAHAKLSARDRIRDAAYSKPIAGRPFVESFTPSGQRSARPVGGHYQQIA